MDRRWVWASGLATYLVGGLFLPFMVSGRATPAQALREVGGLASAYPLALWTGLSVAAALGAAAFAVARGRHPAWAALGLAGPWLGWAIGQMVGWRAYPWEALPFFTFGVAFAWPGMLWGALVVFAVLRLDRVEAPAGGQVPVTAPVPRAAPPRR